MSRKPKFRPVITRVKLDPEQAVLSCGLFFGGRVDRSPIVAGGPAFGSRWFAVPVGPGAYIGAM